MINQAADLQDAQDLTHDGPGGLGFSRKASLE
jgi:hypothetical protein